MSRTRNNIKSNTAQYSTTTEQSQHNDVDGNQMMYIYGMKRPQTTSNNAYLPQKYKLNGNLFHFKFTWNGSFLSHSRSLYFFSKPFSTIFHVRFFLYLLNFYSDEFRKRISSLLVHNKKKMNQRDIICIQISKRFFLFLIFLSIHNFSLKMNWFCLRCTRNAPMPSSERHKITTNVNHENQIMMIHFL